MLLRAASSQPCCSLPAHKLQWGKLAQTRFCIFITSKAAEITFSQLLRPTVLPLRFNGQFPRTRRVSFGDRNSQQRNFPCNFRQTELSTCSQSGWIPRQESPASIRSEQSRWLTATETISVAPAPFPRSL